MKYIKRNLENVVLELNREYPVILITGPRQVGKTTMLQKLMEKEDRKRQYVSLDDFTERALARSDPGMFLQIHHPPILIDEVQYAPELFTYIKIQADKQSAPGDFWLTGSQVFRLMRGVQESLAGRAALLHLSPLTQQEMEHKQAGPFQIDVKELRQRQEEIPSVSTPEIYQRIFGGGMPALVSGKYTNRTIFYSSYISTYLERDAKDISSSVDSLKFMSFLTATAARTAQMVNYKGIADDCDTDQVTIKKWLRILETLGIVFFLHPYSNNVLKRMVKKPKLYFYDTGLACYLTRWSSSETVMAGAMSGALLENYAVSEILKSYQNAGQEAFLYYYRDKDAKEIDILMERDGKLYPMEIKKTAAPEKRMIQNFSAIDRLPLERGTGAILCMSDHLGAFDSQNLIVPIGLI